MAPRATVSTKKGTRIISGRTWSDIARKSIQAGYRKGDILTGAVRRRLSGNDTSVGKLKILKSDVRRVYGRTILAARKLRILPGIKKQKGRSGGLSVPSSIKALFTLPIVIIAGGIYIFTRKKGKK